MNAFYSALAVVVLALASVGLITVVCLVVATQWLNPRQRRLKRIRRAYFQLHLRGELTLEDQACLQAMENEMWAIDESATNDARILAKLTMERYGIKPAAPKQNNDAVAFTPPVSDIGTETRSLPYFSPTISP